MSKYKTTAMLVLLACAMSTCVVAQESSRPPASSLTHSTVVDKAVDSAGFIRRWLLLEPIAVSGNLTERGVQDTLQTHAFADQLTVLPHDGDSVKVNDATLHWHAVDTLYYNVNLYHFAWALSKPTSNVLFWTITVVDAPKEMTNVRLAIGSNAASNWWFNGERVIELYSDRQTVIDDGVSKRLTLHQGRNVIRAAVINAGGATDFCARFLDADDKPITNLKASLPH